MTLTDNTPYSCQIFHGDDPATELSGSVRIVTSASRSSADVGAAPADEAPSKTRCRLTPETDPPTERAFRIAPLVRVLGQEPKRLVLVGEWRIAVTPQPAKPKAHNLQVTLEVHDLRVWSEESDWAQAAIMPTAERTRTLASTGRSKRPTIDAAAVVRLLSAFPLFGAHPSNFADAQSLAAVVCKASAEASRGAVKDLRNLRYDLEAQLSWALTDTEEDWGLEYVARLARIGTAVGQARDVGRAAVREGFWLYLDDDDAYHAYRKAADPSLLTDTPPATAATQPWMRSHDAGARQCRALEEELTEEAGAVAGILNAATAVALSHEAQVQDEFNRWAGVAALGLGLPSVVLAYLGASDKLQLYPFSAKLVAILPVFAALAMAFVLTRDRLPAGTKRPAWMFLGVLALLIVVTGIAAGVAKTDEQKGELTPPSPESPSRPG